MFEIQTYYIGLTRLIFPVVNAGVIDERMSFHSWPRALLTIRRTTLLSNVIFWIENQMWSETFGKWERVNSFDTLPDDWWNDQSPWRRWPWWTRDRWPTDWGCCRRNIQKSCRIFSPNFDRDQVNSKIHSIFSVIRVINNKDYFENEMFLTTLQMPQRFPKIGIGLGPGIPRSEK